MNGLAAAKDLSGDPPRGLDAELEGYAWLPRMLDKARATLAGTPGRYVFGCPVDHTCLARLGISPGLLLHLAGEHADDSAVLAALRAHGIPDAADAWFDAQAVEDDLQATGAYLRVRSRHALPPAAGGRVFAGAEHCSGLSVVIIDADPAHAQHPHIHPVEEVVVVHEGEATFFLGPVQARIIRPGDVVQVPRRVVHRWRVSSDHRLRAVAVYPAPLRSSHHPRSRHIRAFADGTGIARRIGIEVPRR
jgi:quercetin dioxygenase-like cupin family protein